MVAVVTSSPLVGGLLGAGIGIGVLVAVTGWLGLLDRPRRARPSRPREHVDQLTLRVALAVVGLTLAGWWTRWPAAMASCAVIGWLVPSFVGLRARRRRQLARSEAVAAWAEMLRDLLVSNAGLHEAIGKSARFAPAAIRDEVKALYVRTQRGELATALARFADDMDDGIADTVVTALQIADQRAVADLGQMLAAVASSTRETVAMQLRINAARARTYRTAQLITGIVAFFVGLLGSPTASTWRRSAPRWGSCARHGRGASSVSRCGPWSCSRSPFDLLACCGSARAYRGRWRDDLGRDRRRRDRRRDLVDRPRARPARPTAAGTGRRLVAPCQALLRPSRPAASGAVGAAGAPSGRRHSERLAADLAVLGRSSARHAIDKLGYALVFLVLALIPAALFPLRQRRRSAGVDRARRAPLRRRRLVLPRLDVRSRAWTGRPSLVLRGLTLYVDIVGIAPAGGSGVEDALMVAAQRPDGAAVRRAARHTPCGADPLPEAVARPRRPRNPDRRGRRCENWPGRSISPPNQARGSARR